MGRRNYLIDGVSGAGKTAVCTELQRRGYQAIHGDRELAYQGDPETGQPTEGRKHERSASFISEHHIWNVEKVKALAANQEEAVTFFCGGSKNASKYIALFDGVFVLEVDLDTSLRRIAERVARDPTDWGGTPAERDITVCMYHAYHAPAALPHNATLIDATAPLACVVDEILRRSDIHTPH
jgi:adenylate kinase family enzyme